MNNKKRGSVEFSWIFALIVGGSILFFAFFFVGQQFFQQKQLSQIQSTQTTDILLTPFSSSGDISSATSGIIKLQKNSYFEISCEEPIEGNELGYESITIIPEEYKESLTNSLNGAISEEKLYDKYIFGKNFISKEMFTFSKPLKIPWRVADLVYVFPYENVYCFKGNNLPNEIKKELISLDNSSSKKHFLFSNENSESQHYLNDEKDCTQIISFGASSNSDIEVISEDNGKYIINKIEKNNDLNPDVIYSYSNALFYAAIFSEKEVYECNLKRIFSRASIQTEIYNQKNIELKQKQCVISLNLQSISNLFNQLKDTNEIISANFKELDSAIINLENQNKNAISQSCGLY